MRKLYLITIQPCIFDFQSSSTAAPKFPAGPRQSTPSQAAAPLPRAAPRQKKPQPANLMMPGRQGYTDRLEEDSTS